MDADPDPPPSSLTLPVAAELLQLPVRHRIAPTPPATYFGQPFLRPTTLPIPSFLPLLPLAPPPHPLRIDTFLLGTPSHTLCARLFATALQLPVAAWEARDQLAGRAGRSGGRRC